MPKIAIIEDDRPIAEMYELKFKTAGYDVGVAEDGKKGFSLVEHMKPDVILLDLMMPEMMGGEMLAKLRATDWGKDIKVIVLTNVGKDEALPALTKFNVAGFIVKAHYTPKEVLQTVAKVLGKEPKTKSPKN